MRLSDALKSKRAELFDRLEALSKKADAEERVFDASEAATWDAAQAELKSLDQQLERQVASEQLRREGAGRVAIDSEGRRHPILTKAHKFADRYPPRHGRALDLGACIRGAITGRYGEGFETEQRAMGEIPPAQGSVTIPLEVSAAWLDAVRAASVTQQAGMGLITVDGQNLRICQVSTDATTVFRPENVALTESDVGITAVDLRPRLVGALVRASYELLADSEIAGAMIAASLTGALALAIDQAALNGNGTVSASVDNPLGVMNTAGIGSIATVGALTSFDPFLDAMLLVEANNMVPNAVINSPANNNKLRKLATGIASDKSKLVPPADYAALQKLITTSMPDTGALVGDFTQAVWAMRQGITLESTTTGDTAFKNVQVLTRAIARFDVGVLRPKAFAKLGGIT